MGDGQTINETPIARQYIIERFRHAKGALHTLYRQLEAARTENKRTKIIHRINFWIAEVERMLEDERRRDGTEVPSVSTEGEGQRAEDVPDRIEGRDAGSNPE